MAYLELKDLTKRFYKRPNLLAPPDVVTAVDGVNLSIEKGEILGLVGESGCGKSTLSRLIMQLIPPSEGSVVLEGEPLAGLSAREIRKRRRDFQMVFQDPYASLNPRMTVFTAVAEAIRTRHPRPPLVHWAAFGEAVKTRKWDPIKNVIPGAKEAWKKRRALKDALPGEVSAAMKKVGLDPKYIRKYPHEFSGGQRQRIAVARALATEPKLIIADEPVSALDVSIQSQILNLLRDLRDDLNLTMIFISHDLSVVRYIADRIAVMENGKIVEVGEAESLFTDPKSDCAKNLLTAVPKIRHRQQRH